MIKPLKDNVLIEKVNVKEHIIRAVNEFNGEIKYGIIPVKILDKGEETSDKYKIGDTCYIIQGQEVESPYGILVKDEDILGKDK